jgi:MFS family permease
MTAKPTGRRGWLLSGDFGRFWLGQTVSNLGSSFTFFALPLLVFKLTGSPINLGLATAFEFVPYLLFGLVIGAWVDRVDRKRLMIATDLGRGGGDRRHPAAGRHRCAVGRLGVRGRLL